MPTPTFAGLSALQIIRAYHATFGRTPQAKTMTQAAAELAHKLGQARAVELVASQSNAHNPTEEKPVAKKTTARKGDTRKKPTEAAPRDDAHDFLKAKAHDAVSALFGDRAVSQAVTRESLEEVAEQVRGYLASLDDK